MPRKSKDLDKKMLKVGIDLMVKKGVSGVSVREIARISGANLGMFAYHFGTKDRFVLTALNQIYDTFIEELSQSTTKANDLERVLFRLAKFSRDNREIITSLVSDVILSEVVVSRFLRKNFSKHFKLLALALNTFLKSRNLRVKDQNHAIRFLIGAVGVPNILLEVYNRGATKKVLPESDADLYMRTEAAIHGLKSKFCKE